MTRFLACLGLVAIFAALGGCATSSSGDGRAGGEDGGDGGAGGEAGTGGAGGVTGFGGTGGIGGSVGDGGSGGAGGEAGMGGAGGVAGAAGGGGDGGGDGGASGNGLDVCPKISEFQASPRVIPSGQTESTVSFGVVDPDMGPEPFRTRLGATTGTFDDPTATSTTYTCGGPGTAEITVEATNGDPVCDIEQTISIECPSGLPINLCPNLYTVNAIPSNIPPGKDWTEVQRQADDPDDGPLPLVTTFYAFRGSFDDPNAEDTVYRCERSGLQEVCVDASDGACVKTLCTDITCPDE